MRFFKLLLIFLGIIDDDPGDGALTDVDVRTLVRGDPWGYAQFLGATVPHCSKYFSQPQAAWAFLGRMANVLGGAGSKPSTMLLGTGRRLLELVYNTAPQVCVQRYITVLFCLIYRKNI